MAEKNFKFCTACGHKVALNAKFCAGCGAALGAKEKSVQAPTQKASADASFTEADNVGTRLETFEKAHAFWISSVSAHSKAGAVKEVHGVLVMDGASAPPFVAYNFKDRPTAEDAITALSYITRARDTGNLISTELLNFGCYEILPGIFEVIVFGDGLTPEMYEEAMRKLAASGGTHKSHKEPPQKSARKSAPAAAFPVTFVRTEKKGGYKYHIYRGPGKEAALAYLKALPLPKKLEYHIVETPDGNFGRDVAGMFDEDDWTRQEAKNH
jgi:zinc-ribbon domain